MENQALLDAGLTNGESKVYLALLRIGESSVGNIARDARVSLSKIYEILENLINKGLVSSVIKNNVKYFSPAQPERIIDYLEYKKKEINNSEEEIKKIIPYLKKFEKKPNEDVGTIFQGVRGIKTFYEEVLRNSKKGDEIKAMGIPKETAEKYEAYFLDWNRRRAKKGISIKLLFDYDSKELGKKREKIRLSEVRYLPKKFKTPAWILISKNSVATIHMNENAICFVIRDKNAIQSYNSFFDGFWEIASRNRIK